MKKIIPFLIILIFASCKKEIFSTDLTKEFSVQSTTNGAKYNIKVALPQDYSPLTQKYAAIYVLDGEENFNFIAEKCSSISSEFATSNVLVIGIRYGNGRAIDYTPVEGSGGVENGILPTHCHSWQG